MFRFVWQVTNPVALADATGAAIDAVNQSLVQGLQLIEGPSPVFRDRGAALTTELGAAQVALLGRPDTYFQAWAGEEAAPELSLTLETTTEGIGGTIVDHSALELAAFDAQLLSPLGAPLQPLVPGNSLLSADVTLPQAPGDALFGGDLPLSTGLDEAQLARLSRAAVSDSLPWTPPVLAATALDDERFCREPQPIQLPRQLLVDRQRYLFAPADEIVSHDVLSAWVLKGGFGAGVKVVDVEKALRSHESLGDRVRSFRDVNEQVAHGAAVLSLLCGRPVREGGGVVGLIGLAPEATPFLVSSYETFPGVAEPLFDPAWAIIRAFDDAQLAAGDVLLVEVNAKIRIPAQPALAGALGPEFPITAFGDGLIASRIAVARGIHVIHAACNDGQVLEARHDSGAIIVGAVSAAGDNPGFQPNTGDLVQLHAWGRCVASAGGRQAGFRSLQDNPDGAKCYTFFDGTSAAAAVVAGAVAAISGVLKANNVQATPDLMRRCLIAGGKPLQGDTPEKPRRMLYVPGALQKLEEALHVTFERDEQLAALSRDELVAEVADRFASTPPA